MPAFSTTNSVAYCRHVPTVQSVGRTVLQHRIYCSGALYALLYVRLTFSKEAKKNHSVNIETDTLGC